MNVVVITGSRWWKQPEPIHRVVRDADLLVVGDATGADSIAFEAALHNRVPAVVYCASPSRAKVIRRRLDIHECAGSVLVVSDWNRQPRAAGVVRNSAIVASAIRKRECGADVRCFAAPLPGSVGTYDCMRKLERAGFDVQLILPAENQR